MRIWLITYNSIKTIIWSIELSEPLRTQLATNYEFHYFFSSSSTLRCSLGCGGTWILSYKKNSCVWHWNPLRWKDTDFENPLKFFSVFYFFKKVSQLETFQVSSRNWRQVFFPFPGRLTTFIWFSLIFKAIFLACTFFSPFFLRPIITDFLRMGFIM